MFEGIPDVRGYADRIKKEHFREWVKESQTSAIIAYTMLQQRLMALK
jgi:hypothetical protein